MTLFVVVSGLPGSGKTTLARGLASVIDLPLIDKDDILDRLFEERGIGDAAWRRRLSRESDRILQNDATRSNGAILASLWHMPGMPEDSGTPTDWLRTAANRVVNVHCSCPPAVAAARFVERRRHAGHLDGERAPDDVRASLQHLSTLPPLGFDLRIDVDTSREPDINLIVDQITRLSAP